MTLIVSESTDQVFCRMLLFWFLFFVFFFLFLDGGTGVRLGKEDHRGNIPLLSHHISGTYCQPDDARLGHLAE